MDTITQLQLKRCRDLHILPASTCDEIAKGELSADRLEIVLEALADHDSLYDLFNYISVNLGW